MLRRNSRARVFNPEVVVGSNKYPKARVWIRAGLRVVENPGPVELIPLQPVYMVGVLDGSPVMAVYAENVGHGLDPVESWAMRQASGIAGSSACGFPFDGDPALPPLLMLVQLEFPP